MSEQPGIVVQLVAPGAGGVRDYADALAEQWNRLGLDSELLALTQAQAAQQSLAERLQRRQSQRGSSCALLLHYSGYGFQRRGLCHWLAHEVEQARLRCGDSVRVTTMFHELFACGPPWRSAFWLASAQARIAARLARASHQVLTNTAQHARWLSDKAGKDKAIAVWPVFSNAGEPPERRAAAVRSNQLIVFGSASTRRRALAQLPRHAALLMKLGIRSVVEVGSGERAGMATSELAYRFVGRLDTAELGYALQQATFGLIDYPPALLAKSGVFAAYAAHGNVVLNTSGAGTDSDGLSRGRHFLILDKSTPTMFEPLAQQAMADAAHAWYLSHALGVQARALAATLGVGPMTAASAQLNDFGKPLRS